MIAARIGYRIMGVDADWPDFLLQLLVLVFHLLRGMQNSRGPVFAAASVGGGGLKRNRQDDDPCLAVGSSDISTQKGKIGGYKLRQHSAAGVRQ